MKKILNDKQLDDRIALRRAGLTLAGAVDYIHPYENGNGRASRVVHYLIEFGNERGTKAMEEELYAVIAKSKMYDVDRTYAFADAPPPELGQELMKTVGQRYSGELTDPREFASKKVELFLEMMQGKINVPINTDIPLHNLAMYRTDSPEVTLEKVPAGSMNGLDLYEKQYLYMATIPNRKADEIPQGGTRVKAEREVPTGGVITLNMDFV